MEYIKIYKIIDNILPTDIVELVINYIGNINEIQTNVFHYTFSKRDNRYIDSNDFFFCKSCVQMFHNNKTMEKHLRTKKHNKNLNMKKRKPIKIDNEFIFDYVNRTQHLQKYFNIYNLKGNEVTYDYTERIF